MGRQRTERARLAVPIPMTHLQCTASRWSTHGEHLERRRELDGEEKQKWRGRILERRATTRTSAASCCRVPCHSDGKGVPPIYPLEGTTPSWCMGLIWSGPPQCSAILPFAKLSMSQ